MIYLVVVVSVCCVPLQGDIGPLGFTGIEGPWGESGERGDKGQPGDKGHIGHLVRPQTRRIGFDKPLDCHAADRWEIYYILKISFNTDQLVEAFWITHALLR